MAQFFKLWMRSSRESSPIPCFIKELIGCLGYVWFEGTWGKEKKVRRKLKRKLKWGKQEKVHPRYFLPSFFHGPSENEIKEKTREWRRIKTREKRSESRSRSLPRRHPLEFQSSWSDLTVIYWSSNTFDPNLEPLIMISPSLISGASDPNLVAISSPHFDLLVIDLHL